MSLPLGIQLRLHSKEEIMPSNKNFEQVKPPYPVYYKSEPYKYNGNTYMSYVCEIYFKENLAIGLGGINPRDKRLGYHEQDIERIVLLVDAFTKTLEYVFFSAHAQEGKFYPANECSIINNQLIVYVSLGSHSLHPKKGTTYRMFGFANDHRNDKGLKLDLIPVADPSIWYVSQNREVFDSSLRSFLLPLYLPFKNKLKEQQKNEENKMNL